MENSYFWGKKIEDWEDIYRLLVFRGGKPLSFKDLYEWMPPKEPAGCMDVAFDLAEAREIKYKIPVRKWIYNILTNKTESTPCK